MCAHTWRKGYATRRKGNDTAGQNVGGDEKVGSCAWGCGPWLNFVHGLTMPGAEKAGGPVSTRTQRCAATRRRRHPRRRILPPESLTTFDATIVPLPVRGAPDRPTPHLRHLRPVEERTGDLDVSEEAVPIARITPRQQAKVAGRVRSIQVQRSSRIPTLELTIIDTAGDTLIVVFLGRRRIAGIQPGTDVSVEAMVASRSGGLSMLNPIYEILLDGPTAG